VKEVDFANALPKGLIRFATFVGANRINVNTIKPVILKKQVEVILRESLDIIRK